MPSAENHRRVAAGLPAARRARRRLRSFRAALLLEPKDAVSFDGLARVWRDWGLPNLGLGDAHRAIYYAPSSPTVYNTLGTLLQQLGQTAAAQSAFEAALRRDPEAPFALNNLCYAKLMQGHSAQAVDACRARAAGAAANWPPPATISVSPLGRRRLDGAAAAFDAGRIAWRGALQYRPRAARQPRFSAGGAGIRRRHRAEPGAGPAHARGRARLARWRMARLRRHGNASDRRDAAIVSSAGAGDAGRDRARPPSWSPTWCSSRSTRAAMRPAPTCRSGVGLVFAVIEPILEQLKVHQLCEVIGGAMIGGASYRYRLSEAGHERAHRSLARNLLRRHRARHIVAVPPLHGAVQPGGPSRGDGRAGPRRLFASGRGRGGPRRAGTGDQRRALHLHLRTARERQERHGGGRPQAARRRDRDSARARSRGPDHPFFRSRRSTSRCRRRSRRTDRRAIRSTVDLVPASDGDGRRRAHARIARARVQPAQRRVTARRFRRWPTAASSSSTTSDASGARRATCSIGGWCRSNRASST